MVNLGPLPTPGSGEKREGEIPRERFCKWSVLSDATIQRADPCVSEVEVRVAVVRPTSENEFSMSRHEMAKTYGTGSLRSC